MTLLSHLQRQFEYDSWANREEVRVLVALSDPPATAVKLLNHIVAAQWLWLDRLQQNPQRTGVWPELSLADCDTQLQQLESAWRSFLSSLSDEHLASSCNYKNSRGETWTNSVLDILTQLILHAAYHRGQISTEIRLNGNVPVPTDHIHAVRQGFVK
ncbi:MAG: DinB family protein [Candidatus Korobacteraceae bacterium]